MPCVSEFFGISIYLYYNDHAPPHFHAKYADDEAAFAISDLSIVEGKMSRRAKSLVVEWAKQHLDELSTNWDHARQGLPLQDIAPLD